MNNVFCPSTPQAGSLVMQHCRTVLLVLVLSILPFALHNVDSSPKRSPWHRGVQALAMHLGVLAWYHLDSHSAMHCLALLVLVSLSSGFSCTLIVHSTLIKHKRVKVSEFESKENV